MNKRKKTIWNNKIYWTLILLAVSFVFSYLRPIRLDEGGELTFFSMLTLVLIGYFYGWKWMFPSLVIFIAGRLWLDSPFVGVYTLEGEYFDYIVGYGLMLVGGVYAYVKKDLATGYVIAVLLRYMESIVNCMVFYPLQDVGFWGNFLEGVIYSAKYVILEGLITYGIIHIKVVKEVISYWKYVATHDKKIDLDTY